MMTLPIRIGESDESVRQRSGKYTSLVELRDTPVRFTINKKAHRVTLTAADTADTYEETVERLDLNMNQATYQNLLAYRDHLLLQDKYNFLPDLSRCDFDPTSNALTVGESVCRAEKMLSKSLVKADLVPEIPHIVAQVLTFADSVPMNMFVRIGRRAVRFFPLYDRTPHPLNRQVPSPTATIDQTVATFRDRHIDDESLATFRAQVTNTKRWFKYQLRLLTDRIEQLRVRRDLPPGDAMMTLDRL